MRKTISILFALALVLSFSLVVTAPVAANDVVELDSFDNRGLPSMDGELTTDGESLFLEVRADPMATSGNNAYMAWLIYTGDAEPSGFAGPWDDAYLLLDNWFSAGPQGNVRWGVGSGSTHPWSNQGALPSGVEVQYATDGDVGIWTMTVPYGVIGVELGDTICYMVQGRHQGATLTLFQSHGGEGFNPLYFSENFQCVSLTLPVLPVCVGTFPGTGMACLTPAKGALEDLTAVPVPPGAPGNILFPHGMFSFKITGLDTGETVTVEIELPSAVPAGTRWWKHHNGSWYSLPIGTTANPKVITITLTDGTFPGDTDSIPGHITDPGGPGNLSGVVGWEGSPVSKAGVLAPWLVLLAAIVAGAGLFVWKRRRAEA